MMKVRIIGAALHNFTVPPGQQLSAKTEIRAKPTAISYLFLAYKKTPLLLTVIIHCYLVNFTV